MGVQEPRGSPGPSRGCCPSLLRRARSARAARFLLPCKVFLYFRGEVLRTLVFSITCRSLAALLVPWLAAWLASLVAAWLAACLADCLLGCLVGCLVARCIRRLLGWLSDTGNTGVAGMFAGSPTASPRAAVGQRRSGRDGARLSDMAFGY